MRRVRRPAEHDDFMDFLKSPEGPFSTLAEIMTFAAGVGWANSSRTPFSSSGETIDWDVFERLGVGGFVDMLAAVETEQAAVLGPERGDERLTIFEEYAAGGLNLLRARLADTPAPLDVLLSLVREQQDAAQPREGDDPDFAAIVDDLSS